MYRTPRKNEIDSVQKKQPVYLQTREGSGTMKKRLVLDCSTYVLYVHTCSCHNIPDGGFEYTADEIEGPRLSYAPTSRGFHVRDLGPWAHATGANSQPTTYHTTSQAIRDRNPDEPLNIANPISLQDLAVVVWIMHLPHCCNVSRSHSKSPVFRAHDGCLDTCRISSTMLCYVFRFRSRAIGQLKIPWYCSVIGL